MDSSVRVRVLVVHLDFVIKTSLDGLWSFTKHSERRAKPRPERLNGYRIQTESYIYAATVLVFHLDFVIKTSLDGLWRYTKHSERRAKPRPERLNVYRIGILLTLSMVYSTGNADPVLARVTVTVFLSFPRYTIAVFDRGMDCDRDDTATV
uniref:Uncharacterized protein n=1 Tax=Magallana gigas TaxID=29159 RepID=K1QK77_MAGGI